MGHFPESLQPLLRVDSAPSLDVGAMKQVEQTNSSLNQQLFAFLNDARDAQGRIHAAALIDQLKKSSAQELPVSLKDHLRLLLTCVLATEVAQKLTKAKPQLQTTLQKYSDGENVVYSVPKQSIVEECLEIQINIGSWLYGVVSDPELPDEFRPSMVASRAADYVTRSGDGIEQLNLSPEAFNMLRLNGVLSIAEARSMPKNKKTQYWGVDAGIRREVVGAVKKYEADTASQTQ